MTENLAGRGEGLAGAIACVKEFIAWATEQIGTSEAHGCAEQAEDALKLLEAAAPPSTAVMCPHCSVPLSECVQWQVENDLPGFEPAALATPSPQAPPEQESSNAFSPTSAREQSSATASVPLRHGVNCEKKLHVRDGYLHGEEDDTPYDVDGVKYCGRCHIWLDAPAAAQAHAEYFTDMVAGQAALDGATQEQPAGSEASDSAFLSELRVAVLLVPNMLNELGDLDDSGGEPEYAHDNPLKNIVSNVKAHCLGVCISIDEKLAGSPRKVGEDGAKVGDEVWVRGKVVGAIPGVTTVEFPSTDHHVYCLDGQVKLARPSSAPVGEQKQEEGV